MYYLLGWVKFNYVATTFKFNEFFVIFRTTRLFSEQVDLGVVPQPSHTLLFITTLDFKNIIF